MEEIYARNGGEQNEEMATLMKEFENGGKCQQKIGCTSKGSMMRRGKNSKVCYEKIYYFGKTYLKKLELE